jgi:hypothetical protein
MALEENHVGRGHLPVPATLAAPHAARLDQQPQPLVCDVGGGTTDLSLFEVRGGAGDLPLVTRIAVSDHILLGGDNIDAAIAEKLVVQFTAATGGEPSFNQRTVLRALARQLKEQVLDPEIAPPPQLRVSVPGSGASLFAAAVSVGLSASELTELVMEGFFPHCSADTRPEEPRGGLREVGLPFARDPRVTAHIGDFIHTIPVDAVLFNGGTLASPTVRDRIVSVMTEWQGGTVPRQLDGAELDVAVARGAAWYSFVIERNIRKLIVSGYPRSLYLELYRQKRGAASSLLCIVPKGFSSLEPVPVHAEGLHALVERPVRFQVWSALERPADAIGDVVELVPDRFRRLAPLAGKLSLPEGVRVPEGGRIPVQILSALSETGLCKVECKAEVAGRDVSWMLTFNVREGVDEGADTRSAQASSPLIQRCTEEIDEFYGKRRSGEGEKGPRGLIKSIEQIARKPREEWDIGFMRALWPAVARGMTRRSRSLEHEVSWFTVAGFLLRPGFGDALDSLRIDEAWQVRRLGLAHPRETAVRGAECIFWRRLSGGLDETRQMELMTDRRSELSSIPSYGSELIRMLGSLERLSHSAKAELIQELLGSTRGRKAAPVGSAIAWAIERLSGRVPVYAELDTALPASSVEPHIDALLQLPLEVFQKGEWQKLLIGCARLTGDPRRDVSQDVRGRVQKRLRALGSSPVLMAPLTEVIELERAQVAYLLGDNLPAGFEVTAAG